jgi:hypothetical protein
MKRAARLPLLAFVFAALDCAAAAPTRTPRPSPPRRFESA